MPERPPRACGLFLFDLDGTLIDSKEDIAGALNRALGRSGLGMLTLEAVIGFVGEGVWNLIGRALRAASDRDPDEAAIRRVLEVYLEEYEAHLLDATRLYPDVPETLDRLAPARFGVVTNKPERFSRRILEGLGIGDRFSAIVGGDSVPERKPHPGPLLAAMATCRAHPAETIMVGDSAIDVAAGHAAGLFTCGITSGFRGREELERAGCDLIIERFAELPEHFEPPDRILDADER